MNEEILIMIEEELQKRQFRRETMRRLRDNSNPFELPEDIFKCIYRLDVQLARDLFKEIVVFLPTGRRSTRTPPIIRFFTTLHFLAHGSYQKSVGQDQLNSVSQPNVSRAIKEVTDVIVNHLANRYIKFPENQEEFGPVKYGFFQKHELPGVVGCIDCTHIKIVPPDFAHLGYPPNVFMNRKGFYSINCQVICDVNMNILNINARFPGSVHDAAIWRSSAVRNILDQNFAMGDHFTFLIGDSGYPLQPYLLTPILGAAEHTPEAYYSKKHREIRNVIERFNGVFKGVWRCLHSDRVLHYHPERVAKIIYTCAVLHNFARQRNIIYDDLFANDENNQEEDDLNDAYLLRWGNNRNRIVRDFFDCCSVLQFISYRFFLFLVTYTRCTSVKTNEKKN